MDSLVAVFLIDMRINHRHGQRRMPQDIGQSGQIALVLFIIQCGKCMTGRLGANLLAYLNSVADSFECSEPPGLQLHSACQVRLSTPRAF